MDLPADNTWFKMDVTSYSYITALNENVFLSNNLMLIVGGNSGSGEHPCFVGKSLFAMLSLLVSLYQLATDRGVSPTILLVSYHQGSCDGVFILHAFRGISSCHHK